VFLKAKSMLYLAVLNSRDASTNQHLAAVAKSIGVSYTTPDHIFGDVSDSHAKALNHGMGILLKKNTTTTTAIGMDGLTRDDILFLLDSDMFLTSPMDLLTELGGSHIWSVMLHGSGNITYCWPNFSVIHFAGLHNGDALLDELDWRTCQRYRGFQPFDSGGCTARLLDDHPEIKVAFASKTCTVTVHYSELQRMVVARTNRHGLPKRARFWKSKTDKDQPTSRGARQRTQLNTRGLAGCVVAVSRHNDAATSTERSIT
jgi:hypothetical protein